MNRIKKKKKTFVFEIKLGETREHETYFIDFKEHLEDES